MALLGLFAGAWQSSPGQRWPRPDLTVPRGIVVARLQAGSPVEKRGRYKPGWSVRAVDTEDIGVYLMDIPAGSSLPGLVNSVNRC